MYVQINKALGLETTEGGSVELHWRNGEITQRERDMAVFDVADAFMYVMDALDEMITDYAYEDMSAEDLMDQICALRDRYEECDDDAWGEEGDYDADQYVVRYTPEADLMVPREIMKSVMQQILAHSSVLPKPR